MKVMVIGLGSMGKRRIRLLSKMYPKLSIIGVDSNEERVQAVSEEYSIACYVDLEQALAKEAKAGEPVSVAMICASPLSHAALIHKCLTMGLHVFTEINLVADGYRENMALAEEKGCKLFLSSTPVYRAEMRKIKEVLENKDGNAKRPVNYVYHVGQYLPDWHPWEEFHQFFVGNKRTNGCREILAIELPWMVRTFGKIIDLHSYKGNLTDLHIEYPDNYFVYLTHEDGSRGVFIVDVVCREAVRHMEIYNEHLYMDWNGTPDSLRIKNLETKEMEKLLEKENYERRQGYSAFVNEYAYINELEAFFAYLEKDMSPAYDFAQDLELLQQIDQIEGI